MRSLQSSVFTLTIGAMLALSACSGGTTTSQLCFSQVPAANVQSAGNTVTFTVSAAGKVSTFAVPKDAFGGAPAALKNGDAVSFCANQVGTDSHATITLSQFAISMSPRPTSTP